MVKKLVFLLCTILGITQAKSADLPVISDSEQTVWYLVQFLNQGNVLEAQGNAIQPKPRDLTPSFGKLKVTKPTVLN